MGSSSLKKIVVVEPGQSSVCHVRTWSTRHRFAFCLRKVLFSSHKIPAIRQLVAVQIGDLLTGNRLQLRAERTDSEGCPAVSAHTHMGGVAFNGISHASQVNTQDFDLVRSGDTLGEV